MKRRRGSRARLLPKTVVIQQTGWLADPDLRNRGMTYPATTCHMAFDEMTTDADFAAVKHAFEEIRRELHKAVVAQDALIEQLLIALLSHGHCLVEGPPGAAKSRMAASLARVLGLSFDRVRCTPDLTPHDVVGLGASPKGNQEVPGPIFANIVLVDDIGRLAPRTESLIQQAIQDDHITLDGRRHWLPTPFLVLATQYPDDEHADVRSEQRDDRFMFKIAVGYPEYEDEFRMAEAMTASDPSPLEQVVAAEDLTRFREIILHATAPPHVIHYALRLVRATRVHEGETPDFVYEWIDFGAGPRAAHQLTAAARVRAALHGRGEATTEDVRAITHPILRHRLITNRNARSNGVTVDRVIRRLLYEIPERKDGDDQPPSPQAQS